MDWRYDYYTRIRCHLYWASDAAALADVYFDIAIQSLGLKMTSTNPMKPNGDVTDGARAAGICPPVAVKNIPEITPPSLNIVMLVVGTRGDVQPFAYFGQVSEG